MIKVVIEKRHDEKKNEDYLWKDYFNGRRYLGFAIVTKTYTTVNFFKKNKEYIWYMK